MKAPRKLKIAVLISGRGSNMGALARACMNPQFPAEIVMVLSNRPHVAGLDLAREHNLPIRVVDHKDYETRGDHEAAITEVLESAGVELICMAGYMRILEDGFISRWRGQLINIHPSLLPSFRGVNTHERALERGVRIHGCTVHFVNAELDGGPIVAQAAVPVMPHDNADMLSARVLEMEHKLYPKALELIATKRVRWSGDDAQLAVDIAAGEILFWSGF